MWNYEMQDVATTNRYALSFWYGLGMALKVTTEVQA